MAYRMAATAVTLMTFKVIHRPNAIRQTFMQHLHEFN